MSAIVTNEARYLLIDEVARELRFDKTAPADPAKACRQWLARNAVPVIKRGKGKSARVFVDRHVLRAVLERNS